MWTWAMILSEVEDFGPDVLGKMKGWSADDYRKMHQHAHRVTHKYSEKWVLRDDNDEPVVFGGVYRATMLGAPFFWFVTCEAFYTQWGDVIRTFILLKGWFVERYGPLTVATRKDFAQGERFARYFGAEPKGESADWRFYKVV